MTETGALIAAAAAATYPIIHLGRPWLFFWNLPYPNTLLLWPQFRSPLYWDAVDIISYLGVALIFWTIGLLPDLATLRDRAIEDLGADRPRAVARATVRYRGPRLARLGPSLEPLGEAYRITAVMGILLVVSLQTGAAVMFAGTVEPGWHDTLLPFSFLAAAVFAGTAFMAAAAVVLRYAFGLEALITEAAARDDRLAAARPRSRQSLLPYASISSPPCGATMRSSWRCGATVRPGRMAGRFGTLCPRPVAGAPLLDRALRDDRPSCC